MMDNTKIEILLDWDKGRIDTQPANVAQVQTFGTDVVLTFGLVLPPIELSGIPRGEIDRYLSEHKVPVQQIRRVVMSRDVARQLMGWMQSHLSPAPADPVEPEQEEAS